MRRWATVAITVAVLAGCSNDQYSAEKEYWKLGRQSRRLLDNPAAAPVSELERLVQAYARFIETHRDSPIAVEAGFTVARLLMLKPDHGASCRGYLEKMIAGSGSQEVKAEALYLIGTTYQEEYWQSALSVYRTVITKYPRTRRGLNVPVYIAECYRARFEPLAMRMAYFDAIAHYNTLAAAYPHSLLAYEAGVLSAHCHGGLGDWQEAVNVMERLIGEFKANVPMDSMLMNIALICKNRLNDPDRCRQALKRLIAEYPSSRLSSTAKALIRVTENDDKRG